MVKSVFEIAGGIVGAENHVNAECYLDFQIHGCTIEVWGMFGSYNCLGCEVDTVRHGTS